MKLDLLRVESEFLSWAVAVAQGEEPLKIVALCDEGRARLLANALNDCGVSAIAFKQIRELKP